MYPYPVPLYIDKGRDVLRHINDLNVRPFVRERGMEPDNIVDCTVTRRMLMMNDCAFTIVREHDHVLDSVPSAYMVGPFCKNKRRYLPLTPPRGNMLIVMHDLTRNWVPRDILPWEVQKVTARIIQ